MLSLLQGKINLGFKGEENAQQTGETQKNHSNGDAVVGIPAPDQEVRYFLILYMLK